MADAAVNSPGSAFQTRPESFRLATPHVCLRNKLLYIVK